jgi:hypothetical protein
LFADERGQVTAGLDLDLRPSRRQLEEFGERRQPVDRPLPTVAPETPSGAGSVDATPGVSGPLSGSQDGASAGGSAGLFDSGASGVSVPEAGSGLFSDPAGAPSSGGSSVPGGDSSIGGSGGPGDSPPGGSPPGASVPAPSPFGVSAPGGGGPPSQGGAAAPGTPFVSESIPLAESSRPRFDVDFEDRTDREQFTTQPTGRATPEFRNPIAQLFPGLNL